MLHADREGRGSVPGPEECEDSGEKAYEDFLEVSNGLHVLQRHRTETRGSRRELEREESRTREERGKREPLTRPVRD